MASSASCPVILVTGASTGLGWALAQRLIGRSCHLILTARESSLRRFAAQGITDREKLWLRPLDVTDAEQRQRVVEEANDRLGGIDVLVNNAGRAYRSVLEHVTEEELLRQMDINYRAPVELTRLVLPRMREKQDGRILTVSSASGMMSMPTMSVYSASKFALEGAMEALWYEVRPWNIKVSLIVPGFINSMSVFKVQLTHLSERSINDPQDPYHRHYAYMSRFIERVMRLTTATPETVARIIVRTIERKRPPLRISATPDAYLFALMRRVIPRPLYHYILYRLLPGIRTWGPEQKGGPRLTESVYPKVDYRL